MATMHRARAVLNIDRKKASSVKARAKAMKKGIGDHPDLFAKPNPALNDIDNQVTAVDKAEVEASTKAKGTAKARDVQVDILVGMLDAELLYVQGVADQSPTPKQAAATIEAAGLGVAHVSSYQKPALGVKQGPTPGSVALEANAAVLLGADKRKKSFFNWQYTINGGATWTALPPTPRASTTAANLTPLAVHGFRVSVTHSNGVTGEWSPVVSFPVH